MSASVRDIAQECRVSVATVSRALNGKSCVRPETQRRVFRAAQRLGYRPFPNSDLTRRTASPLIGLILTEDFASAQVNPFYSMGLAGIQEELTRHCGAFTVPAAGCLAELRHMPFELSPLRGVDGILILCRRLSPEEYEGLRAADVPSLFVAYKPQMRNANYIGYDRLEGVRMSARHLVEAGHTKIAYVGYDIEGSLHAFTEVLDAARIRLPGEWAASWGNRAPAGLKLLDVVADLLNRPDAPTAFCCHGDGVAIELIRLLRESGRRVPEDFSVVGFDDTAMAAACHPPLTTVRQPIRDMALRGVRKLLEIAEGKTKGHREVVSPELIVRSSTAPPRQT